MKREDRVHVVNVRVKIINLGKGIESVQATVVLGETVDGKELPCGEMSWEQFLNGGCEALAKGEW